MAKQKNITIDYDFETTNMEITPLSYADLDQSWNYKNACAPYSRVYFPIEGSGVIHTAEGDIQIVPGNIYIIPSMLCFSYSCPDRLKKYYSHITITDSIGFDALSANSRVIILPDRGEAEKISSFSGLSGIPYSVITNGVVFSVLMRAMSENTHFSYSVSSWLCRDSFSFSSAFSFS